MKKLVFVVFVMFFVFKVSAQESHSIFGKNHFYADLISKAATLDDAWGLLGGARVGYNFDENISLGLVAHGLIPVKLGGSYVTREGRDELHLGYGGIEAAYNYYISDKFYFTGIMMIGAARTDYKNVNGNDYFFIMEPGAAFNYRLTDWFGLGYAINYRLASGVKYADFSNATFGGWTSDISFKFRF